MKTTAFLLLAALAICTTACNKDKRASKRFMKPGTWQVTELSVNGTMLDSLPTWLVNECDIYEDLCTATWRRNGVNSQIHWQFNDKAQSFKISRVVPPAECENFYTELVQQHTYEFSGEYKVIETKKSRKVFESNATIGHAGQKVRIVIETE
jgi:hypothetical protein